MKKINVKGVSNTLSDKEMKLVKGGVEDFAEDTAGDVVIDAVDYCKNRPVCSDKKPCSGYKICVNYGIGNGGRCCI